MAVVPDGLRTVGSTLTKASGAIERVAPDYESCIIESRFGISKKLRHA